MLLHKADRGQAMLNHAAFVEQLRAYADRARCLLVPIWQSHHYTLLVLERWGQPVGSETEDETLPAWKKRYGAACHKDPAEEAKVFDQLNRPLMSWVSAWEITYYDSASVEYTRCRKVAGAVLEALGLSGDDLPHRKKSSILRDMITRQVPDEPRISGQF